MSTKISYYFSKLEKFPIPDFFEGITETYEILQRAKTYLKEALVLPDIKENHGEIRGDAPNFHGNYYISEGTIIYNDVTIIGPVFIGKNCEIMPGAVIRPNTIIADGCSVGHGSEVKHCVMFGGSKIASLAFAGDSILGASARIGSGVITANRKFNQTNATIKVEGERVDLGDSFFGCILGDSSRLGANAVSQPGTHIGPNTWVYPLTNVRGTFLCHCLCSLCVIQRHVSTGDVQFSKTYLNTLNTFGQKEVICNIIRLFILLDGRLCMVHGLNIFST